MSNLEILMLGLQAATVVALGIMVVVVLRIAHKLLKAMQALPKAGTSTAPSAEEIAHRVFVLETLRSMIVGGVEFDPKFLEEYCTMPNLQKLLETGLAAARVQAFMERPDLPNVSRLHCRTVLSRQVGPTQDLT